MTIDIHTYTNQGARDHNEDAHGIKYTKSRCIAILCDGLGGHDCGEVASQAAVDNMVDGIAKLDALEAKKIQGVMKFVNDGLLQMQSMKPELKGMRTTTVGCALEGNKLHYFNVGDSRFYYFSNGVLRYMSKDHSISQVSVDMGEMSFDDIRTDPSRNRLLKVLGEDKGGDIGSVYEPITCKKGDAFLLCSDGFWENVLEEEMEIDLSKSKTAKNWLEYMLVRLLLRFTDKNDNYTVIGGIIQ